MILNLVNKKIKNLMIISIDIYQKTLSPDRGFLKRLGFFKNPVCVFYPSCSEYAKEVIGKYGIRKGVRLSLLRISRCHPWQKNHIDPVK
jgi:putative membrane protein insertion efficiency factor